MKFAWRLFSKRSQTFQLGLADPTHPARKWIDAAGIIVERRLEVKTVDGKLKIESDAGTAHDLVGALDLALGEAPDDPDILVARAAAKSLMHADSDAKDDIRLALRSNPNHFEANAVMKYGSMWDNILFLPSWSPRSAYLHSVLVERANRGDILHCVLCDLQVALVLLLQTTQEAYPVRPARYRWEVMLSETPFGPIGAHYSLIDVDGQIRRQECILAPTTKRSERSESPPPLLGRLSSVRTCFIVLAEQSGKVLHNLKYDLPPATRSILNKVSQRLSEVGVTDASAVNQATQWHMQHFDIDGLTL